MNYSRRVGAGGRRISISVQKIFLKKSAFFLNEGKMGFFWWVKLSTLKKGSHLYKGKNKGKIHNKKIRMNNPTYKHI
jgi:hypothetical protein